MEDWTGEADSLQRTLSNILCQGQKPLEDCDNVFLSGVQYCSNEKEMSQRHLVLTTLGPTNQLKKTSEINILLSSCDIPKTAWGFNRGKVFKQL